MTLLNPKTGSGATTFPGLAQALASAKEDADKNCSDKPVGAGKQNCGKNAIPSGCEYLNKPSTVEATKADFDRIRKPVKLSDPKKTTYKFPGNSAKTSAFVYEAEVDEKKVSIYEPSEPPKNKNLPSAQQIADALGSVPTGQLDSIRQVVISPNQNPKDSEWAVTYKTPGFTSAATGGNGGVTFYPSHSAWTQELADSTMIHEGGHNYSQGLWKDSAKTEAWKEAVKKDPYSPSSYSDNAATEDFSESLIMYSLSKGTKCEEVARQRYPNRYKILDELLAKKAKT